MLVSEEFGIKNMKIKIMIILILELLNEFIVIQEIWP